MSFLKYLSEMAIENSSNKPRSYYSEEDKFNKVNKKLLGTINGFEIFLYKEDQDEWYFLASDGNYMGYIAVDGNDIFQSHSKLSHSFYKTMFNFIIPKYKKFLNSDMNLSSDAIKSYTKLSNQFNMMINAPDRRYPFSPEKLRENPRNTVYVTK